MSKTDELLAEWLERGGEYVIAEAPEVAAEIIHLGQVYFWMAVTVTLATPLLWLMAFAIDCRRGGYHSELIFVCAVLAASIEMFAAGGTLRYLPALIAPKVYIIQYLSGL